MYVGPRLREVLSRLNTASSIEALRSSLADAARHMGFPYVVLFQHGGLPRLVEKALMVTNYPEKFVQSYIEDHHYIIDPICEVSEQLDRPFTWDEIPNFVKLTGKQIAMFEKAREYGIAHGVTVPLHIPSESYASTAHRSCPIAGR